MDTEAGHAHLIYLKILKRLVESPKSTFDFISALLMPSFFKKHLLYLV